MHYNIIPVENKELEKAVAHKINNKTKPLGALGQLEDMALRIALIQEKDNPEFINPTIAVFASDHGIAQEKVSAYPSEVTAQMVLNFINGGAAINVFSNQHNIQLKIIDAGVNYYFQPGTDIINAKIGYGTKNFLHEPAMTKEGLRKCFHYGEKILEGIAETGTNIVGFGEMGIGNTSAASVIMSLLLDLPIEDCVGRGTGLNDELYRNKISVLQKACKNHSPENSSPYEVLQHFGGFEIAMMTAAMLKAAEKRMVVMIDGFIASSAFLCAYKINPNVLDYSFFCHLSQEKGHRLLLDHFDPEPLLKLNLRLGEGTGCAMAYPILLSSVLFLNNMASFESAGVSEKEG